MLTAQGLEYTPFPAGVGSQGSAIGGLIPDSAEFFEVYGFGSSTALFPSNELPDDVIGFPGSESDRQAADPNVDRIDSLPGGEALPNQNALYGEFENEIDLLQPLGRPSKIQLWKTFN